MSGLPGGATGVGLAALAKHRQQTPSVAGASKVEKIEKPSKHWIQSQIFFSNFSTLNQKEFLKKKKKKFQKIQKKFQKFFFLKNSKFFFKIPKWNLKMKNASIDFFFPFLAPKRARFLDTSKLPPTNPKHM